jgi:aspartate aminotransferase-like enzyme
MNADRSLKFKIATEPDEFEQIHRLNYKTFVEEIPQHQPNADGRLVDKFHAQNTYAVCLRENRVVGMVAGRGQRPFSLDQKLDNLDAYLPAGRRVCEIRLLSVEKNHRHTAVARGIMALLARRLIDLGFDMAVISGTLRQLKLYEHLGFVPFGPVVGAGDARFQPMSLTLETFRQSSHVVFRPISRRDAAAPLSFLPGPVDIHPSVRRAFQAAPVSHRSRAFLHDFEEVRQLLRGLVKAEQVAILLGSGTMANDAIAGQLSLLRQPGLVLSHGEFGQRLVAHAKSFGLTFDVLETSWGRAFDNEKIRQALSAAKIGWLWAVHCETSTGVLNDLAALKEICGRRGIKLCLDCISSIGAVPVDLRGVYLASCVSGKGLAAYPGLSMVFYHHAIAPGAPGLPRCLDLGLYAASRGTPFTHSSNLIDALRAALRRCVRQRHSFSHTAELSAWLRGELRTRGFFLVADNQPVSPAVVTVSLASNQNSDSVGERLEEDGLQVSYRSEYLLRRNWIQICLMGECTREKLTRLLARLENL